MEFRNLKEFHRCKALEDVNEKAFDGIVENMAKVVKIIAFTFVFIIIIIQVLEISEDRKEELKLAKHSQTMVNVIEDFEHGKHGFYNYGKILKNIVNMKKFCRKIPDAETLEWKHGHCVCHPRLQVGAGG